MLSDHLGLDLGQIHTSLLAQESESLDLQDGFDKVFGHESAVPEGAETFRLAAIRRGRVVLIPYLVAPAPGPNSGTQGFAAALRSAFQAATRRDGDLLVLVILDRSPVETIVTAAENGADLPELAWERLARRVVAEIAPGPAARTVRAAVEGAAARPGDADLLDLLLRFAERRWASEASAGQHLHELKHFLSDPDVVGDPARRLETATEWRAKLDGWTAPGVDLDARLASAPSITTDAADRISAALVPGGLDYSQFTLADVLGTARAKGLRLRRPLQIEGAPSVGTVIQGRETVAVWLAGGHGSFRIRVSGDQDGSERVTMRRPAEDSDATIVDGEWIEINLRGEEWVAGSIELQSPAGRSSVGFLAFFGSGSWFPVERSLDLDIDSAAFVVVGEPELLAVGSAGTFLGPAVAELPEDAGPDVTVASATAFGETWPIPLLVVGEDRHSNDRRDEDFDDDGAAADGSRDPDDSGDDREGGRDGSDSIPTDRLGPAPLLPQPSPVHALLEAAREGGGMHPGSVSFRSGTPVSVGGRAYRLSPQDVGASDGLDLEASILDAPATTAFVVSNGVLNPALDGQLTAGSDHGAETAAFLEARQAFFAAVQPWGTVLGLGADLPRHEALEYCRAYASLLNAIPRGERYRPGYDPILLVDSVTEAATGDVLVAPTNPLSVAFYVAFATAAESWVDEGAIPSATDVESVSLRHLFPSFSNGGRWFESMPGQPMLWRRYRPMYQPGSLANHDAGLIAGRLRFFLNVYPAYDDPRQRLSVSFHDAGDGATVLRALRAFYRPDIARARRMSDSAPLERPALDVTLVTDAGLPRHVRALLEGSTDDLGDRILRQRVRFRLADPGSPEAARFSHVAFLFRSQGTRTPWPVDLGERSPTSYVGGLAAAPGRATLSSGGESAFAWGTFAPHPTGDAGCEEAGEQLGSITRSLLELVGGQPRELVQDGLTRMPTTVLRAPDDVDVYDAAVWVVHLDRLLGLEAFAPSGAHSLYIVDYSESDDPAEPGLDAITVTGKVEPYHHALTVALADMGTLTSAGRDRILQILNGVSGRWALQLLRQAPHQVRERIGTATAIAGLIDLDRCFEPATGHGVLVPLDEVWAAVERRAAAAGMHPSCDDLVYWHVADGTTSAQVTARLIEVKFRSHGQAAVGEARVELETAADRLQSLFGGGGAPRLFRGRDLAELLRAARTRSIAFGLHAESRSNEFEHLLELISAGEYDLSVRFDVGGNNLEGDFIAVEAENSAEPVRLLLPGSGRSLGMVRLGRSCLDRLARGESLHRPRRWASPQFPSDVGAPEAQQVPTSPQGEEAAPAEGAEERAPVTSNPEETGKPGGSPRTGSGDPEAERLASELTRAAAKYGLELEPFQPHLALVGPSVIRFRTRPLGRQSLAGVQRLAPDIGREVGAGEGVIVDQEAYFITIDVPRAERETVAYRDYAAALDGDRDAGALDFLVGMAPSGEVRVADLARLPHLLVAGATGSGKSVFLRGLLSGLVRHRTPEQLRLLVVDPKQVDFMQFEDLPHLMHGGILADPRQALEVLADTIERERDARLPVLRDAGVTSILEYYEAGHAMEELPQITILVDEFADLATSLDRSSRERFMSLIQRYGQITRAFGIYLVLATQRPSVQVITGDIKANLTARVALKVQAPQDSVTILGRGGAERLRDQGDLIFDHGGRAERLQGFFATSEDARDAVARWADR